MPKKENSCRDALLTLLKRPLGRFDIECVPEGDYVSDKRADISVSYRNELRLPIEIKRESHADLWVAAGAQLSAKYMVDPRTGGRGDP